MGWLYLNACNTRKQLIDYLNKDWEKTTDDGKLVNHTIERSCVRGSVLWQRCHYTVTEDNKVIQETRYINMHMMRKDHQDNCFGFKSVEETMGPYHVSCPKSYLEGLSEPSNDFSRNWRERVRNYWDGRKKK
jgi:hypothetical protein